MAESLTDSDRLRGGGKTPSNTSCPVGRLRSIELHASARDTGSGRAVARAAAADASRPLPRIRRSKGSHADAVRALSIAAASSAREAPLP